MSTGYLAPPAKYQPLDNNGNTVPGGKLYTYVSGTTTPLATYSDVGLTTPNANPVILDAGGRCTLFLPPGTSYRFSFKTAADALIWTQDDVQTTVISATVSRLIAGTNLTLTSTGAGGTGDVTVGFDTTAALSLTNNLTVGGLIVSTGAGVHNITAGSAGSVRWDVRNTDAGAAAYAGVTVGNDAVNALGQLLAYSSIFSSSGHAVAGGVALIAAGSGGLSIAAVNASGALRFYAGGTTEMAGLTAAGVWSVNGFGAHTFSAAGVGINSLAITNSQDGAANQGRLKVSAHAATATLDVYAPSYTTAGTEIAASARLYTAAAGGVSVVAAHASGKLRFYAGGTTIRWTITAAGVLYGGDDTATPPSNGVVAASLEISKATSPTLTFTATGGPSSASIAYSHAATSLILTSAYINVSGTLQIGGATVSFGANDSGGVGYKVLRVPN